MEVVNISEPIELYLVRLREDGAHDGDDVGGGGEAVEAEHALELLEAHHRRRAAHEPHDRGVRQKVHDETQPAQLEFQLLVLVPKSELEQFLPKAQLIVTHTLVVVTGGCFCCTQKQTFKLITHHQCNRRSAKRVVTLYGWKLNLFYAIGTVFWRFHHLINQKLPPRAGTMDDGGLSHK